MSVITRMMNRGAASLLSTLAFVVAGGTAAFAVPDCFVSNGTQVCCATVSVDCGDGWSCESSAVGGPVTIHKVKLTQPGGAGQTQFLTTTTSHIWTTRTCGPQLGSCVDVATFVKTCQSQVPTGDACVGANQ